MQKCLAILLTLLVLLQSFGREVVLVDYALHQARITEQFCINKARPRLHCNGRCHLRKQLARTADADKKPGNNLPGKLLFDAPGRTGYLPAAPEPLLAAARAFAGPTAVVYQFEASREVFRPPLIRLFPSGVVAAALPGTAA